MLLGLALMVSGAIVLVALRRALWQQQDEEPDAPPDEQVPYVGKREESTYDPIDIPLDDADRGEYGARPIYVPPVRGTVYMSRRTDWPE
ncbi:hypothetical protein [Phytohabitans kaempferiae]|uniref:Secreted protein n=1 Tax=Phytohabitans kaempferiae TaxID=1620943 RepID=A0ABV6M070_9ACTN